jgi:hypothetical protein
MDKLFETLVTQLFKELCGEGERRIKLQALSVCLEVVRGMRRVFITLYLFCFACFLSAISFFATSTMLFDQFHSGEWDLLNPRLLFSFWVFVVSSGLLALTVREKRWASAFDLEEKIRELQREPASPQQPIISEEMIARLIDAAIEKRLKPESTDKTA